MGRYWPAALRRKLPCPQLLGCSEHLTVEPYRLHRVSNFRMRITNAKALMRDDMVRPPLQPHLQSQKHSIWQTSVSLALASRPQLATREATLRHRLMAH